jgi:hypothetical protein
VSLLKMKKAGKHSNRCISRPVQRDLRSEFAGRTPSISANWTDP